jgi:hypothetical protein
MLQVRDLGRRRGSCCHYASPVTPFSLLQEIPQRVAANGSAE